MHPDFSPAQTVRVDGVDVHYTAIFNPDSPLTLLFLHGFGATLETWTEIYRPLSAHASVVRIDFKGSGFSSKPAADDYSIPAQAALVCGVIAALGLHDVVLVGHSFGGAVAIVAYLDLAGRSTPSPVAGLVLIDGAGYRQRLPFFVNAVRYPWLRWLTFLTPARFKAWLVLYLVFTVKSQVTRARVDRYAYFLDRPGTHAAMAATAAAIVPPDAVELERRFPSIGVPTLIIWGANDRVIPVGHAHRFAAEIPGSVLHILRQTGHVPQEERPEAVADLIARFVRSLTASAAGERA